MTAQELINNARSNLKIDPNKKIWLDDDLLRWMNEGIRKFEAKAEWYKNIQSASVSLGSGVALYPLEDDFRIILDQTVKFTDSDGQIKKLTVVDYVDLVNDYTDITTTDDSPQYAYLKGGNIGFYPVPNATATTGSVAYEYYGYSDDYVLTDIVDFPINYIDTIENYIEYKAWGIIPGKSQEMSFALDKYNIGLKQALVDILRQKGPYLTYKTITKPYKR